MTARRLIEAAFPLRQASLDSVHEKNVRHGHVSTLHIWPARRPLAAARAALIAALLPDPGTAEGRRLLLERIGGRVVEAVARKRVGGRVVETTREETTGGILHWGREDGPELDRFRAEIRAAHGGRAPRVLDPFAGGGAIPLEAMRLGCRATAVDINPVAWLLLKCTLDYPRRLAGRARPLPGFARADAGFMEALLKARGFKGAGLRAALDGLGHGGGGQLDALPGGEAAPEADLAWHVRAWGRRALARAREKLAGRYPTYAEWAPLQAGGAWEARPLRLLEAGAEGPNAGLDAAYLKDPRKPRWVAKPTAAYLWARTVACRNCRARIPLLKTRWLARKEGKRALLTMAPDGEGGIAFGVRAGSAGDDGAGTMSRAGATCPHCGTVNAMEDIRLEGRAGRLGAQMTAVVVDGPAGKEYRAPEDLDSGTGGNRRELAGIPDVPFGLPGEPLPGEGALGFRATLYGLDNWGSLFTDRQKLALATFVAELRACASEMDDYPEEWREALAAYLGLTISRLADRGSTLATWDSEPEKIRNTFARFALPMMWDFAESCPLADTTGSFIQAVEWIARVIEHLQNATAGAPEAQVLRQSAIEAPPEGGFDAIVTDPPYYDAIPYSDLMDFFHVWLRRVLHGLSEETDAAFAEPLGPKWDREAGDGELIDDASRFGGDRARSKAAYEDGMARAFRACHKALNPEGRLVVVFANKSPDAWETLAAALIRAGFVVAASWPIQTEMQTRQRSMASAALSSSVWLVCRKRAETRPGWDGSVLADMRANVARRLREFWDAGIRGPGFRVGGDRAGARSVQPLPGGQDGERAGGGDAGLGVPRRGAAHGGRFRGRAGARPGRRRRGGGRARRRDRLLPAPPPRFRDGRRAGGGVHPVRAVLQPVGFGARRAARPAGAGEARGGRRRGAGAAQAVGPAARPAARPRGRGRAPGAADRPGAPADAAVAGGRPGGGGGVSGDGRPRPRRAVRPRAAGADRTGRGGGGGARGPGVAEQPSGGAGARRGAAARGVGAGGRGVGGWWPVAGGGPPSRPPPWKGGGEKV